MAAEPQTAVEARLDLRPPQIEGRATFLWRNPGPEPLRQARLLLFANRFARPPEWNDLSRHFLLFGSSYRPGGMEVSVTTPEGRPLVVHDATPTGLPEGTVVAAELPKALAPGEVCTLEVSFRTVLPNLLDVFGTTGESWVAAFGWHPLALPPGPFPAALAAARVAGPVRYSVAAPPDGEALLGSRRLGPAERVEVRTEGPAPLAAVRGGFTVALRRFAERQVTVLSFPPLERTARVSHNASPLEALLDTLPAVLGGSSEGSPLTIVRAPLGWLPSAPAAGAIFVSDRLFAIHPILRPLHQRELAYAVFLAEETERARGREPPEDVDWVAQGLAWRRAQALYASRFRSGLDVRDWIRLFDVFAIVDRFETAPRVPFVRAFFPVLGSDDPLRLRPESLSGIAAPGRQVFYKLEARLRPERFAAFLARYAAGRAPFRETLRSEAGEEALRFLEAWLGPWPDSNYAVVSDPDSGLAIAREGPERPDTVEVEIAGAEGVQRQFVDLDSERTPLHSRSNRLRWVEIDPARREIESRLDDNRYPASLHWLLDSSDVEVSSTEFGLSALVVGRRRYDYRKDLGLAGFVTNRSVGANLGIQLHGGPRIDPNLFRRNLFAYVSLQRLDRDFEDRSRPKVRTSGRLGGFGLRYNDSTVFWFENPSNARHLRVFFDAFDPALGSDFGYLQTGASVSVTPRLSADTVLALQGMTGFSVSTGRRGVPNQGRFSLGGFRSIRGIGAEEELGQNIALARVELRRMLGTRLDWNFEDLFVGRRLQLRVYLDAGRVDDRRDRLYRLSRWALGGGIGFGLFYDFLGFFPSTVSLDLATRLDRTDSVQVLFGARQPF